MKIKTRESLRTIKTFDRAKTLGQKVKNGAGEVKEYGEELQNTRYESANEYAGNAVENTERRTVRNVAYGAGKIGNWGLKETRKNILKWRNRQKKFKVKVQQPKQLSAPKRPALPSAKTTAKTAQKGVKTAQQTAKAAAKTAKATVKAAQKAAQAAKAAAKATVKFVKVAAKAIVAAVKATVAAIKGIVAAIAAGGWVAVVIIIVICLIGLIVGSCFGIFFSGDDTGSGMTMQTVISDINTEYEAKINETKGTVAYDVLEMSGSRAVWPEVLSVYAVKTAGDPNNPQEVASMDESKKQILKDVFWAMNEISFNTATKTENVVTETDDGNGNIVETTESVTRTYLYIRVTHKSADEMAQQYGFTDEQKEQLRELLSDENKKMWSGVLYGYYTGGEDIVSVAISQVGNIGGQPYWSWYGFSYRVEWCACFVSWCANECGYILSVKRSGLLFS